MKLQVPIRALLLAAMAGGSVSAPAQVLEPTVHHDAGDGVTGVFEGWFHNPDGSVSMLVGYYNRNLKEQLDIPVGPNNRIEPGGPDYGQPTHFHPGRMWGNFVLRVPREFGPTDKLQWTITANGKTSVIPLNLKTDWELSPFKDADENTPPMLSLRPFEEKAPFGQGPIPITAEYEALVGVPLRLQISVADDNVVSPATARPKVPISIHWTVFRSPLNGLVRFNSARPIVERGEVPLPPGMKFAGTATTLATFDAPGNYILEITVNDATGDGGGAFQCCWTNGLVNVTVSAPRATASDESEREWRTDASRPLGD